MILICPTHHRIIDTQPDIYTVDTLLEMKAAHEVRIRDNQQMSMLLHELNAEGYASKCNGLRISSAWRFGSTLVVACSLGSDPVRVKAGRWRGSGLQFRHDDPDFGSEELFFSSEGEPDVEYWVEGYILNIVKYTYDPISNGFVPFSQHYFDCSKHPASRSVKILMNPHSISSTLITELVHHIEHQKDSGIDFDEKIIYELRNAGLSDPKKVIDELKRLKQNRCFDGCVAEAVRDVICELELVLSIKLPTSS